METDVRVMSSRELEAIQDAACRTTTSVLAMTDYIDYLRDELERVKEQGDTYRDQRDAEKERFEQMVGARAGLQIILRELGLPRHPAPMDVRCPDAADDRKSVMAIQQAICAIREALGSPAEPGEILEVPNLANQVTAFREKAVAEVRHKASRILELEKDLESATPRSSGTVVVSGNSPGGVAHGYRDRGKSVVVFRSIPAGETATAPHNLCVSGTGYAPDRATVIPNIFEIVKSTAATITVRNTGSATADCAVSCELFFNANQKEVPPTQ